MRKFLTYLCSALLVCGNVLAYSGSYSAYDLYRYASSGDFRILRDGASNINTADANGQTAICYAINNRDYVAYKNLAMLHADEHPSCVKSMNKQDYEDFKRGYELRGGTISSSYSLSGSTIAWTAAGLAAVGGGIAIAAGGGGGGGGKSSSDPTPAPTPTPTPAPSCEGYNLNACLPNSVCEECIGATRSYFKLTGCVDGYIMNAYNTGCIPNSSIATEYPLLQCDPNGQCASAMSGNVKRYKLISCNQGYEMDSTGMACVPICEGYTTTECNFYTQYISETCSRDANYHKCADRTVTEGCDNYKTNADECTSCTDKYKLVNGVCEQKCKGFTQVPCENNTQYISEICADNSNYHKCATRTNKNCAVYVTDKDECSACNAEFILKDGACVAQCEGYTLDDCTSDQYISAKCHENPLYHQCKDRTVTEGCMQYETEADRCVSCYPGYRFNNGKCDQICIGYTNKSCQNRTQYISGYCADDNNFHICTDRTNTEGCADYEVDKDLCTACYGGYNLENGKCISVCPGYTQKPCDTLEYKGENCTNDPSFHLCKARKNTNACADFDPNEDKCTSCVDGYFVNNGICQLICPGYTKADCPISLEYEDEYCAKDSRYHTCTPRKNKVGCVEYEKTSDNCTVCNGTSSTPVAGKCECKGYVTEECDKDTQYVSAVCPTAAGYHVCSQREYIDENCKKYDPNADKCLVCNDEYKVVDGYCSHVCVGYTKEACENDLYYIGETCEDDASYHKCEPRENTMYCSKYFPTKDECTDCKDGYKVENGSCVKICPGFTKEACGNGMHQSDEVCDDPEGGDYHKCERDPDAVVIPGCKEYTSDNTKCKICEDWYTTTDGTTCTLANTNSANCEKPVVNRDCCTTCKSGYMVDNCSCVKDPDAQSGSGDSTPGGDTTGCTSNLNCSASQYKYKGSCSGDEYKECKSRNYYDRNACDTFAEDADKCAECEKGYGWYASDTNTEDTTPNLSTGKCRETKYGGGGTGCSASYPASLSTDKGSLNVEGICGCTTSSGGVIPSASSLLTGSGNKCKSNQYYGWICYYEGNTYWECHDYDQASDNCEKLDPIYDNCLECKNGYHRVQYGGNSYPRYKCEEDTGSSTCSGGTCKSSCDRNTEYIDSCSSCGSGQVFCRPRINVSAGCKTYDEHSDVCDECFSATNYDLISGTCIPKGSECMSQEECYTLSNQGASGNDAINLKRYIYPQTYTDMNSYCSRDGVDTSKCDGYNCYICLYREKTIANCHEYSMGEEKCTACESGYGVGANNTEPDENGLCRGNAGYTGTSASYVVKGHSVSENKAKGMTVYTALSNKLNNFGDKVSKYNGYKSDVKQKIIIDGKFDNAVDVTGAYNTNNGSYKGGHGAIEIVRDSKSDTPIKGVIKGLVGGNNYEGSDVIINLDVDDAAQNGKRSFIAGMGKEVGAYTTDKDEISGIDLGSAEYGQHNAELQNAGSVNIASGGTAPVFGILGLRHAGNVANHSENKDLGDFVNAKTGIIDINALNAAEVYGIRVNNIIGKDGTGKNRSVVTNDGIINVSGGSNVYGIAATNADIFNNGDINVSADGDYAYGIYADNSKVENNGNITINTNADNVYGIYAVNNSSVKNNGVININGDTSSANTADGKFIKVDEGSYIINANTIVANSSFDTRSLGGGNILMTNGSNIIAPEVSGKLTLSSDITTGSNNNVYTLQNMVSGNAQNLDVVSQSAMFKASTTTGDGTVDGTLIRSSFNELIKNSSLADYLDKNYEAGNATKLFDDLKNIQTLSKLKSGINDFFGQKMLSRMTFEDMSMMREINLDMNKNMFKQEGAFSFGGNVSPYSYVNNVGSVGRYALHGVNHGKNSYALGISISDVDTYDDNKENSRSDRSFVMSAPLGHKAHGIEFITTPKIGYSYGEYTRNGFNSSYKGKVYKRMYALMNEARYPINIGKMSFTPSAEFNMIGFNIKGSEEAHKPYNLRVPSQNHYSVEAGLGLMAEKEFSLYKHHKFKMNGGVAFYHEFANPYELDVSMSEMDGTYRLHDEKRHNNRVAARFGFDYMLRKDIDISMSMLSNIDGECRTDAVCDMKYHF